MPSAPVYVANQPVAGAPRVDTETVGIPRLPNTIGEAVARLGSAASEFSMRLDHASAITSSMNARTGFMSGLASLVQQYRADPDPTTALDRFQRDMDQLQRQQLGTISTPQLRASAGYHMTVQGLQAYRQMQNFLLRNEQQGNIQGLKTRRAAYLQNAANAGSPTERAAITDTYNGEVDELAGAGFINAPGAAAAKQRFRGDVANADVAAAIAHDPDATAHALNDPDAFPGLDPAARANAQVQADDAGAAAAWRAEQQADRAATQALGAGTLTQPDLDAAAPGMSALAYRQISAALTAQQQPPQQSFDPQTYSDLMLRAINGEDMTGPAADALGAGAIDRGAYQRIYAVQDRSYDDMQQDMPWRVNQREQMLKLLAPQPGQSDEAARTQLDAAANFDTWLTQNPTANQDASAAQMNQVVSQARANAAAIDRAALPLPAGVAATRGTIDGDDIGAAAARVNDAFTAGVMDPGTLVQQTNLLRGWQAATGASAGGGN